MSLQYEDVLPVDKDQAAQAFQSGDSDRIVHALLGVTYHEPDWAWVQDWCLRFLDSTDSALRNTAIACLGHLARIHKRIDKTKVVGALRSHLTESEYAGRIEDAIDDIEMFAK